MQRWQPWQTASKVDWGAALEREAVIRPLADQPRLTEAMVQSALLSWAWIGSRFTV